MLFLYRDLLERELELDGVVRARTRQRVPVVLSEGEVRAVRERLEGEPALVVGLLYGSGLRLMEALRLRASLLRPARGVEEVGRLVWSATTCFPCHHHADLVEPRRFEEAR